MSTREMTLFHSRGESNPYKTILTEEELCQILMDMRDNYDKRDNKLEQKKRVFVDMDNVLVDFESGLAQVSEDVKKEYAGRLDEIPRLFGLMKPMPDAIFAMHELQKHYDLFILSTAPWKTPSAWSDKVKWVTKYVDDVFHKRMVITHRKDLCQGDYLIDDRGKNGTSDFSGEWIEFGSEKFPDWKSVLVYLGVVSQEHLDFIESFDRDADRSADRYYEYLEEQKSDKDAV
jgi:5'(3')-deoxyribonucleotidase